MSRQTFRKGFAISIMAGCCLSVTHGARAEGLAEERPGPSAADGSAAVEVRSTGDRVTVAEITARVVAASGSVVVQGAAWRDLCISPCSFKLEPGLHELLVYGDGVASATRKFELGAGKHALLVKPGSAALETGGAYLTAAGILTTLTGALFFVIFTESTEYHCEVDPSCPETKVTSGTKKLALPLVLGGVAGTGLGIGLFMAGHTEIGTETAASGGAHLAEVRGRPFGVTLSGKL